jgi:CBS domain containing-hemolysin-like protein
VTEDEFEEMVENVGEDGLIEPVETDIIKSTIHFGDILSGEIMTPADQVITVSPDISEEDLKKLLLEEKYSRIPVCDGSIDNVVGVLPAAKALSRLTQGTFSGVRDLMTRPYIIRPDIPVSKVFEGMSGRRTHLAVVADSGKTLGIVTMEDILEELVGEIWDEHDEITEEFNELPDGSLRVSGGANLDELLERYGVHREYDSVTVSGWVLEELGRFPREGETFQCENMLVTVERVHKRRVLQVRVENLPTAEPDEKAKSEKNVPAG